MKGTTIFFPVLLVIGSVFFLSAVNAGAQANSDTAPAFAQSPSIVLDLWKNGNKGKYSDNIKFTNATLYQNISLNVYGYDEKGATWTLVGLARLKNHSDADTISSPSGVKINRFRWFAIHALDNISFNVQAITSSNDILFTIYESKVTGIEAVKQETKDAAPAFNVQSSIVVDLWENRGKGKYEDNLKLINTTKQQNISFNVYGYDQKNSRWILIGAKNMGETSPVAVSAWGWIVDPDAVSTPWSGKMDEFRWIAIHSLDDISFNTQVVISRKDVTITIVNK